MEFYHGKIFGDYILFQIKNHRKSIFTPDSQVAEIFKSGIEANLLFVPEEAWPVMADIVDEWNYRGADSLIWIMDTGAILRLVTEKAQSILTEKKIPFNDEILYRFFHAVVSTFAYNAALQKNFKRHIINSSKK